MPEKSQKKKGDADLKVDEIENSKPETSDDTKPSVEDVNKSESEKKAPDTKESVKTTSEKVSGIEVLFEVISRLRIVLDKTVNVAFGSKVVPLSSFMDKGTLVIKIIESVNGHLTVWYDDNNDRRYILTSCKDKITFSNINEFVSAVISDYRGECASSMNVLMEPERESVLQNSRCYKPEALGFPFSDAIKLGLIDDRYRAALNNLLQGREIPDGNPSFISTSVFEYVRRGEVRDRIIHYALGNSERVVNLYREAVCIHNAALGLQDPDIRNLGGFETLNPTYEFNSFQGILDAMPRGGYVLRYETVTAISGFSATLSPIPTGDLMKSAGASATKASWISDITTNSYHDDMGPEIAGFFASLIVPGEVIFDLDLSDIPESAIELRAIAALGSFFFTLFNSNSTFVNSTAESIITAQRAIVRLGLQNGVFKQVMARGAWPLDDVEYQHGPINDLNGLRVIDGRAGINQAGYQYAADGMVRLFPNCGRRINYAINYDDYRAYSNEVHGTNMWSVYSAINNFISKNKNMSYLATYFNVVSKNIQDFYVRVNEHSKTRWYSALRNDAQVQGRRNARESSQHAIRTTLRGHTILYLMRSLNGKELIPNYPFKDILKLSAGSIRVMSDFAMERNIVENLLNELGVRREFTIGDVLKLVNNDEPMVKYILEIGKFFNESSKLSIRWLEPFLRHELTDCFAPLQNRMIHDLVPKGVLPRIVSHLHINGFTRDVIDVHIRNRSIYVNIFDGECEPVGSNDLARIIENRAFKHMLHDSMNEPLEILFPLPYELEYKFSESTESYCFSINDKSLLPLIKERLEIKKFKLYLLSYDNRIYHCLDDYTPSEVTVQTNFARSADVEDICLSIDDFFAQLGRFSSRTLMICNKRHSFVNI